MDRYFADISNNEPQNIDWKTYRAAGHVLVGLKATEGIYFTDLTHSARSEHAHSANVHVAHYHFAHPSQSAQRQAEVFWNQIKDHFGPKDYAVLDIEIWDGLTMRNVSLWIHAFNGFFTKISGHSIIIYSDESFLEELIKAGLMWPAKRAWIAAYGAQKPHIYGISTWAWQFTDGKIGPEPHQCAGIGKCDISELNLDSYLRLKLSV